MRAPTKAELAAENVRLQKAATVSMLALNAALGGEAHDARESHPGTETYERFVYRLYGAKRADGGVIVVTHYVSGQHPSSSAYYFDDYGRDVSALPFSDETTKIKGAMERLRAARNAIVRGDLDPAHRYPRGEG